MVSKYFFPPLCLQVKLHNHLVDGSVCLSVCLFCLSEPLSILSCSDHTLNTANHQDSLPFSSHCICPSHSASVSFISIPCVLSSWGRNASGAFWTLSSTSSKHPPKSHFSSSFLFSCPSPALSPNIPSVLPLPVPSPPRLLLKARLFFKITHAALELITGCSFSSGNYLGCTNWDPLDLFFLPTINTDGLPTNFWDVTSTHRKWVSKNKTKQQNRKLNWC